MPAPPFLALWQCSSLVTSPRLPFISRMDGCKNENKDVKALLPAGPARRCLILWLSISLGAHSCSFKEARADRPLLMSPSISDTQGGPRLGRSAAQSLRLLSNSMRDLLSVTTISFFLVTEWRVSLINYSNLTGGSTLGGGLDHQSILVVPVTNSRMVVFFFFLKKGPNICPRGLNSGFSFESVLSNWLTHFCDAGNWTQGLGQGLYYWLSFQSSFSFLFWERVWISSPGSLKAMALLCWCWNLLLQGSNMAWKLAAF